MQQAGQSYTEYYADSMQPAMTPPPVPPQDYSVNAVPTEGEAVPSADVYGESSETAMNGGTGLPPIQLRAPAEAAQGGPIIGAGRSFLPESRYAARRRMSSASSTRH